MSLLAAGKWGALTASGYSDASLVRRLGVLFFLSGFPALLYQLVWQRALFRIFGVNIEAVTIVVTAFMVGLGLGSLAGGWLSKYVNSRVLVFLAVIEGMTALFGLASLSIFEWVGTVTAGQPLAVIALVALVLVLMPTLLMGATLPLLADYLSRRSKNTGYSVGYLYFVNTLGAAAACFVAMAVIFPHSGMQAAVYFAVAVNVAVAAVAVWMHLHSSPAGDYMHVPAKDFQPPRQRVTLSPATMLALGAMAGFVALSFEIFLFRIMAFATGNYASAFAAVLGTFLLGIALGSREVAELSKTEPENTGRVIILNLIMGSFAGVLLLPLLAWVGTVNSYVFYAVLLFAVYVIARSWGMILPYLAHLGISADKNTGRAVSWLYLANIAGSAAGSIFTGFVLMDFLPLVRVGQVLALFGVLTIAALYLSLRGARDKTSDAIRLPALAPLLVILAGVLAAISFAPTNSMTLLAKLMYREAYSTAPKLVQVLQNKSGIITVDEEGRVSGHGMPDGHFSTTLFPDVNGVRRPYGLNLLHPAPRNVLMIGLATGSWAQIIANNPAVEKLTIVEINPGYRQLIETRPEVQSVLRNPKVKLIVDDGVRWLRSNPEVKFDFVVSNTTFHFRANATNLQSREFLQLVSRHLPDDGVLFMNTTWSDRVLRTACLSFAHGVRFHNHIAVSRRSLDLDFDRWRRTLLNYKIDGKPVLDMSSKTDREGLTKLIGLRRELLKPGGGYQFEMCSSIRSRTEGLDLVTNDNMGAEWRVLFGLQ